VVGGEGGPVRYSHNMAKASKKLSVASKAKRLREFGFNVSYGKKGKTGPQSKAAVSRAWKKVELYTDNKKQEFVFQPAKGKELAAISRGISEQAVTPKGFFIKKPRGAKKAPRYKLQDDGTIEYRATGKNGGRVIEEIHPIDPELLMEDPPRAILALANKADKVVLTVNGFDSSQTTEYTLDALAYYIAQDLLPKFLDPNIDPEYAKLHGRQQRTVDDFADVFHVKIIKHVKPAKRQGRNRRKRRRS